MKFGMLKVALMGLLGIGRGGVSHADLAPATQPVSRPMQDKITFGSHWKTTGPPPASYNRRNQRKDRKNFRRRLAAGYTK